MELMETSDFSTQKGFVSVCFGLFCFVSVYSKSLVTLSRLSMIRQTMG